MTETVWQSRSFHLSSGKSLLLLTLTSEASVAWLRDVEKAEILTFFGGRWGGGESREGKIGHPESWNVLSLSGRSTNDNNNRLITHLNKELRPFFLALSVCDPNP